MNYIKTGISGIYILEPEVLYDVRGYFMETYKQADFEQYIYPVNFVQDNESCSSRGVLRGLHYQLAPYSQAKLVRVTEGVVIDVAVDLRRGSPTFGRSIAIELSAANKRQLFIPQGFAHGFYVKSEYVVFTYKVDGCYMPAYERGVRFDDPDIDVDWQIKPDEIIRMSEKDARLPILGNAEINFKY